jgi:diguanylate cyclase (GGDEF)-like protein
MFSKRLFGLDSLRGTLRFYAMLLICLPLVLSMLFFALFQRNSILNAQKKSMLESLHHEKTVLRFALDSLASDLKLLAIQKPLQTGDVPAIRTLFSQYLGTHPSVPNIVFANTDGYVTVDRHNASPYIGDREYFAQARQGKPYISDLLVSRLSGTELVTISTPVMDANGVFRGLIFVPFELSTLDHLLESVPVGQEGTLYLADASGHILAPARAVAAQKERPTPGSLTRSILEAQRQGDVHHAPNGEGAMVGAAVPVVDDRWFLVQRRPVASILAGYHRQLGLMALGAVTSILLIMPLLLRLARNLERPLERLLVFSSELRTNRASATLPEQPEEYMPSEMRALYQTFREMARDIREHIKGAELRSIEDPLTGLYNRRFLFDGGTKLLEAAERAQRRCACLMIDVDHFKTVNDTFGHAVGDRVLAHVAGVIHGCARKADLVARYGGEEFAVLLTGADRNQAHVMAMRLRQALADGPCLVQGKPLAVTVSIGVAEGRREVEFGMGELDDLLARADRAMYAAKAAGRNQVVIDG